MHDFVPNRNNWPWPRTLLVLAVFSLFTYLIDNSFPKNAAYGILLGVMFDCAWYYHDVYMKNKSYRRFKVRVLQEAWLSSDRFKNEMTEHAFVALLEDCLRNKKWRIEFNAILSSSLIDCRRDKQEEPVSIRGYWKIRYQAEWPELHKKAALIACIGCCPRNKVWSIRDDSNHIYVSTGLFGSANESHTSEDLPKGIKEFWCVFELNLSRLIDHPVVFPAPKLSEGLNTSVNIDTPCVLPLSDGSYLHIGRTGNKFTAAAENKGIYGTTVEYETAEALWEVWRNAVNVEKKNGVYTAKVPSDVLTENEKNQINP